MGKRNTTSTTNRQSSLSAKTTRDWKIESLVSEENIRKSEAEDVEFTEIKTTTGES